MNKILDNKFILFFMILFFFKPICFQYYSNLKLVETLFQIGKILSVIVIMFYTLTKLLRNFKINKFLIFVLLYELWIFIVTLFSNDGYVFKSFTNAITTISFTLLIVNSYSINSIKTITIFKKVMVCLVFFQFLSELFFPNGLVADLYPKNLDNILFFVTLDNGTASLTCLTILLLFLYRKYMKFNIITFVIQILLCFVTALLSKSTTAIVGTIIIIILVTLVSKRKFKLFDNWRLILLIYFIISALILTNSSIITNILSIFTDNTSFTGRNILWERSINLIKLSPFIGYGFKKIGYIKIWYGYFSSHNFILEMLLEGGIVALIFYLSIIHYSFVNINLIKDKNMKRTLILGFVILLICLLMEAQPHNIYLFAIMSLVYSISNDKNCIVIRDNGV